MRIFKLLFGVSGRIDRRTYWLCLALLVAGVAGVILLDEFTHVHLGYVRMALLPATGLALVPITVKRLHDGGRSWGTLVALVGLLALCASLEAMRKYMIGAPVWDEYFTPLTALSFPLVALTLHLLAPIGGLAISAQAQSIAAKLAVGSATLADFVTLLVYVILTAVGAWFLWQVGFRAGTQGVSRHGTTDGRALAMASSGNGEFAGAAATSASPLRAARTDGRRKPYWLGLAAAAAVLAGIGLWYQFAGTTGLGSGGTSTITTDDGVVYLPADEGNCWTSPPPLLSPAQKHATDLNIVEVCTRLIAGQLKQNRPNGEIYRSYSNRAGAYGRLGRQDEAFADTQEAQKYAGGDELAKMALGTAHLDRQEFAKALEIFDSYKSPTPFSDQMLGRARALEGLGRKQEAISAYKLYEKAFGDGTWGYDVRKTVNEALIRLGDREAPAPAPAKEQTPAPAPPSGGGGSGRPGLNVL